MTRPSALVRAAATVWGSSNDARLWDVARSDGDRAALRYLEGRVRDGAERIGAPAEIAAANNLMGIV